MHGVLERYSWSNLGWRLGVILRAATGGDLPRDDEKEVAGLLFDMLSHLQAKTIEWHNDNLERKLQVPIPDAAEDDG
jgi:hypothetical protein